jgi:chromosomal replication initiation ATPase DnaA
VIGWRAHAFCIAGAGAPAIPWQPRAGLSEIVRRVARTAGIPVDELRGPSKAADLVRLRRIAMSEARKAGHSLSAIGRELNRDHTTVLAGLRVLEQEAGVSTDAA